MASSLTIPNLQWLKELKINIWTPHCTILYSALCRQNLHMNFIQQKKSVGYISAGNSIGQSSLILIRWATLQCTYVTSITRCLLRMSQQQYQSHRHRGFQQTDGQTARVKTSRRLKIYQSASTLAWGLQARPLYAVLWLQILLNRRSPALCNYAPFGCSSRRGCVVRPPSHPPWR